MGVGWGVVMGVSELIIQTITLISSLVHKSVEYLFHSMEMGTLREPSFFWNSEGHPYESSFSTTAMRTGQQMSEN